MNLLYSANICSYFWIYLLILWESLDIWMCVRSCVHVNTQWSVQCFVCRTISEHLGAVQVNRQEGEAAFKKKKKQGDAGSREVEESVGFFCAVEADDATSLLSKVIM